MIELLRKITLIFLTFQSRWVKKKIISYSNGSSLYTWRMKLIILIHELPLMLKNLELMLNVCCPKKFIMKVLAKILRIHFKGHWIPTKRLTPQMLAKVVDLALLVLLLLVTMVQKVELMMDVIMREEILGNANKVNIQWVNSLVKMISHTAYKMKTMDLEKLVQTYELLGSPAKKENGLWLHIRKTYFQGVLNLWV